MMMTWQQVEPGHHKAKHILVWQRETPVLREGELQQPQVLNV